MWRTSSALTEEERAVLGDLPSASPDAEVLLAGLLVRLCLRDPQGSWAVGTFFDDPLNRPDERPVWSVRRRLWGNGNRWELEWTSYPFGLDLVSALTDPVAGIEGAKAVKSHRGWDIVLGDSILALRPR